MATTQERMTRAQTYGEAIAVGISGGLTISRIARSFGMGVATATDILNVFLMAIKGDGHVPPVTEEIVGEVPDAGRAGTLDYNNDHGLHLCYSCREFYYERRHAPNVATLLKWQADLTKAVERGGPLHLTSSIYYTG